MTEFAPGIRGGLDTSTAHFATQVTGLIAREPIPASAPVEIRALGIYKASGTGTFMGVAATELKVGNQAITIKGIGQRFHASDEGNLTPGAVYYLGATAGTISDTPTANDAQGAFVAVSAHDLMVVRIGKLT